ncbi:MAG: hypothetical protein ABJA35_11755 [Parafilimonas sp.]
MPEQENNDIFSFYNNLLLDGTLILVSGFTDFITDLDNADGNILEYMSLRSLPLTNQNYCKAVSHFKSERLFRQLWDTISSMESIGEKKKYWFANKPKIEFPINKIRSQWKSYLFFADDLEILVKDIELRFKELTEAGLSGKINKASKLRWVENTNLLATLFYELWKGQEKLRGTTTKPFIEATKAQMKEFLINNFVDKDNNPLSEKTIDDYLNSSKVEKRAKQGIRIELDYSK